MRVLETGFWACPAVCDVIDNVLPVLDTYRGRVRCIREIFRGFSARSHSHREKRRNAQARVCSLSHRGYVANFSPNQGIASAECLVFSDGNSHFFNLRIVTQRN